MYVCVFKSVRLLVQGGRALKHSSLRAQMSLVCFPGNDSFSCAGGGQYAHTILGVAFNRRGIIRYLILDPHYPGAHAVSSLHICALPNLPS